MDYFRSFQLHTSPTVTYMGDRYLRRQKLYLFSKALFVHIQKCPHTRTNGREMTSIFTFYYQSNGESIAFSSNLPHFFGEPLIKFEYKSRKNLLIPKGNSARNNRDYDFMTEDVVRWEFHQFV